MQTILNECMEVGKAMKDHRNAINFSVPSRHELLRLCLGFVCCGFGASLYVYCNLGSDAFNVFNQGLALVLGMQVGTVSCLAQGAVLLLILPFGKPFLGIGTVVGPFLIGGVMNICAAVIAAPLQAAGLPLRLCILLLAPVSVGFGVSLVKQSGMGLAPYDIIPLILSRRINTLPLSVIRIGIDFLSFLAGVILGGTVGVGTILSVVLTGPMIQLASSALLRPEKA